MWLLVTLLVVCANVQAQQISPFSDEAKAQVGGAKAESFSTSKSLMGGIVFASSPVLASTGYSSV